ncbi:uncharacterized protein LOC124461893 [Drosophila willistoni]|uniref:uncharacterized protein LOC124461893 n=1 Tax=Drosophila willistoni TaxID=7260 RepID=UPI001F0831E7|nr:uncharacterized protein LOC124461893 [Drosophila willistoni]
MPALGMCCSSGKVKLPEIETPPEPLHGLLIGTDPNSSLFLRSIRQFNSCFQMTNHLKGQDGYCINLKQRDPVTAIKLPTAILIFQKRAQRSVAGHVNMRVQTLQDPSAETFSKQLLDIGNGKVAVHENTGSIKLPTGFCTIVHSQDVLIDCIFPDVHTQYINLEWLAERAILAAKNVDVHGLNFKIQQLLPTDSVSYKSVDTVCNTIEAVNYPVEFLNSLDLPGMPPHQLQLKVGSPVILLRNLNPPRLCNGTRLVIKKLMKNVIEATILNGKFQAKR